MQTLYLAGPIEDASVAEAKDWRKKVERYFEFHTIRVVNPYRDSERVGKDKTFVTTIKYFSLINRRDKYLVHQCDLLLVNLSTKAKVVGSFIEMGMFFERDLPIFVWIDSEDKKNLKNHPMLRDMVCVWESDLRKLCDINKGCRL